jgi:hypothetical protein
MRLPLIRKLAVAVVPLAVAGGALASTAAPAYALEGCSQSLLTAAAQAEVQGDVWVNTEDYALSEGLYEAAAYAYNEAGKWFAYADQLRAIACSP